MCGTMNPVGNVNCDKCHARLIPMAAPHYEERERERAPIMEPPGPPAPPEEEREPPVEHVAERIRPEAEREPPVEHVAEEIRPEEEKAADWLTQLRASAVEEVEEPDVVEEPAEPVEIPDWLRDMGPIGVETRTKPGKEQPSPEARWEEQAPTTPPPATARVTERLQEPAPAEVPDWLREIARPKGAPPEAAPPVAEVAREEEAPAMPPIAPAEVPDWLREIAPPEAAPPEAAPPVTEAVPEEAALTMPPPAPAEVPDWLREIAPPEAAPPVAEAVPEEAAPTMPPPAPAEVPDWLREIAPPEAAPAEAVPPVAEAVPEEAAPAMPPPAPAEIPDWLREIAPPEAAPAEAVPPVAEAAPEKEIPAMPPPTPAEVPDWLREIARSKGAPPEGAPPVAEAAPPVPPPMELPTEAPEWLAELRAEPGPPSAPTAPAFEGITPSPPAEPEIGVAEMEGLARAAIPDWLEALRPHPEAPAAAAEAEPVEIEGLLKGVRGALAPITTFQVPAIRESTGPSEISKVSLARAQLLQSLLARPAEALQPQVRKRTHSDGRGVSMGERVQRWLVAAVLLIAVGGILIAPLIPFDIPALTQPTTSPGASRLHKAIQGVSAGDTVLVAFEYGPSEADELDLVAEPILRHVLAQGARISVVSTRPERLAVAEGLLSTIEAPEEQYTQRYRPGDATGVSQLLAEVGNQPTLILVLTAQPGPLRWWVEQAHALYGDTIPVAAGVSAALEPAASPYLDVSAGQMEGAIIGLRGAAAYETPGESPERGTLRLNALAVGHLAIVGLMILGASLYALDSLRGRGE